MTAAMLTADPEDLESAKGVIANQDEDMDILFDIIDTLLAQKEFDEAGLHRSSDRRG